MKLNFANIPKRLIYIGLFLILGQITRIIFGDQLVLITYNPTPSERRGFYWASFMDHAPQIGEKVTWRPNQAQREFVYRYTKWTGDTLMKTVYAGPGDYLEIQTDKILINGRPGPGLHLIRFAAGEEVKPYILKGAIPQGYYFLVGVNSPKSIDSRYLGLVHRSQLLKFVKPLYLLREDKRS